MACAGSSIRVDCVSISLRLRVRFRQCSALTGRFHGRPPMVRRVLSNPVVSEKSSLQFRQKSSAFCSLIVGHEPSDSREMLPLTLQFFIAMIASAISERVQRNLEPRAKSQPTRADKGAASRGGPGYISLHGKD